MQLEFFDVPSPCVGICQSDEKGYCKGCLRTRDERLNWQALDNDNKQKVIKRCIQRKKRKLRKLNNPPETSESLLAQQENSQEEAIMQPSLLDPPSKPVLEHSDDLDFGDFEL